MCEALAMGSSRCLAPLLRFHRRAILWCRYPKGSSWCLDSLVGRMCFVRYSSLWVLSSANIGFTTVRALFMIFWTWAKGLEDEFDGSNRHNLRHFISTEVQQMSERPTRAASPSVRSHDDTKDEGGASEMNVATLDDQFRDEVSLFLHRGISLRRRMTTGMITIQEKKKQKEEKMVLARLSTCAVFHKLSAGKGVPHTFYGLLRQRPSVPRIVVGVPIFTPGVPLIDEPARFFCLLA